MDETFNMRNPDPGEVQKIYNEGKRRRELKQKYKVLSELLSGKDTDITQSNAIFEAVNREKMEFETILNLHPDQVRDTIEQVKIDRSYFSDGKWWNTHSKAKYGIKGHIPMCVYLARPKEYWQDKKVRDNFFNMFPKFRISDKPV